MSASFRFMDCQNLPLSPALSQARLQRAVQSLGETVVQRLMCFALYLLGVNRRAIGEALDVPAETAKSIIKVVERHGLPALEDRRHRVSSFLPQAPAVIAPVRLNVTEEDVIVEFGAEDRRLRISRQSDLQVRTVLLSLLNSGLLPKAEVAEAIGLTRAHTATLAHRLAQEGLSGLIDKRQGQQSDYRMTPEVKAELVQQFTLDVIAHGRTSGQAISSELQQRCQISVPARTVRHHLAQMGLTKIKHSLPQLLAAVKKTSKSSC
jgi:transposase